MWRTSSKFTRFNVAAVSLLTAVGMTVVATPAQALTDPGCVVTGYSIEFDGSSHTASGSCAAAGTLDLSGTVHTDAGTYTDSWSFTPDDPETYDPANGTVSDEITVLTVDVYAATDTKDYDGTDSSAGVVTYSPDPVPGATLACSQTFDSVDAAVSVGITADCSLTTGDADNYSFSYNSATGTIDPLTIDVSAVTDTKNYDSTTTSDGVVTYVPSPIGSDEFTCSQTYDTAGVGTGKTMTASCTVTTGTPGNYSFSYTSDSTGVINQAPFNGTLSYNGTNVVPVGSKMNLAASLSSPIPSYCPTDVFRYEFWDGDDWTTLYTATGYPTQQVLTSNVNGSLLAGETYYVRVHYLGNSDCAEAFSDGNDTITVFGLGTNAYGGGWYTINGKANFGFVVQAKPKTSPVQYKGQVVWNWKNAWRFKGVLNNYGVSGGQGSASGYGTLQYWDPNLYGEGLGGWAIAATNVNVIIKFTATTPSTKKSGGSMGSFVINFGYTTPSGWAFTPLPTVNTLTTLKGGNIKYS